MKLRKELAQQKVLASVFGVLLAGFCLLAGDLSFLRRRLSEIKNQPNDLIADGRLVTYRPLFGSGDSEAELLKSVVRYGELTIDPGGSSAMVSYRREEQIYYILAGQGVLTYGGNTTEVKKDDFVYLPIGVEHGMKNESSSRIRLLVMGFRIPEGVNVTPTPQLMLANAKDVPLQVLGQHGPTCQFRLLMGTTESKRDKIAAANVMVSLFLMDFAPGGTNIPHRHEGEEEIYFLLQGNGEIVAGSDADGREARYSAREGDAFFFAPRALVGFYSNAKVGGAHDLILAVRSKVR